MTGTRDKLLANGGIETGHAAGTMYLGDFFKRQQFVDPPSEGVPALRNILQSLVHDRIRSADTL